MAEHNDRGLFALLVADAYVDGVLTDDEGIVLHRKKSEWGIPIREINRIISPGKWGHLSFGMSTSDLEREHNPSSR